MSFLKTIGMALGIISSPPAPGAPPLASVYCTDHALGNVYDDMAKSLSMGSGGAMLVTDQWNVTEPVGAQDCSIVLPSDAPGVSVPPSKPGLAAKKSGIPSAFCINAAGQTVFDGEVKKFSVKDGTITAKDPSGVSRQIAAKSCTLKIP